MPRSRPPSPVLEVLGLTVRRGPVTVLEGVTWRVGRGEHWAVLGPNGSGKTSLLAALAGYVPATTGTIRLLDQEYGRAHWPTLRRRLGLVTPTLARMVNDEETALEIVAGGARGELNLWIPPTPRERRAAAPVLASLGIALLADRPWAVLSQGERQRALIARALMTRPAVLILDEPCAGLDPVARERFLEFVERLARRRGGPAIVLVTHHVEEITPAFTHALLLRRGAVAAAGPLRAALAGRTLGAAFDAPMQLVHRGGRYALRAG
jgi:iron complex transport system ATP-binding protein